MSLEETEQPNQTLDHVLGWLEDSMSLTPLPSIDDSYLLDEFDLCQTWEWEQSQDVEHGLLESYNQDLSTYVELDATNLEVATEVPTCELHQSKKRNHDVLIEAIPLKRSARSKRKANKSCEKSYEDGNKEERWAEQLLNPCALAVNARNSSRVQHYFCVLSELASPSGDANRRLAAFGLLALQHHLSSSSSATSSSWPVLDAFVSAEVKMFQNTLLKFYEVSPWFALHNNIANSAILQILAQDHIDNNKDLHILDMGVSHGMQWPTLLEALSCREKVPTPRVRITVLSDLTEDTPFSVGPPAYNYGTRLIGFAKSLNINLQINVLDKFQLIETSPHETLIVCVQFRMHQLKASIPYEVSEALKVLRSLGPKGVILCENNGEGNSSHSGDFPEVFSRKLEYLWKFLDSTSSGFKEENSEERKLMEGEATKVFMNTRQMSEGKEKWYEMMSEAGFVAEAFGEEAIIGAKSLLRKYDNNWEMKMEDADTFAGLLWKGEAVSFCSLWK
ncbi:unnamed protein product [Cochlearia groenlandica]